MALQLQVHNTDGVIQLSPQTFLGRLTLVAYSVSFDAAMPLFSIEMQTALLAVAGYNQGEVVTSQYLSLPFNTGEQSCHEHLNVMLDKTVNTTGYNPAYTILASTPSGKIPLAEAMKAASASKFELTLYFNPS